MFKTILDLNFSNYVNPVVITQSLSQLKGKRARHYGVSDPILWNYIHNKQCNDYGFYQVGTRMKMKDIRYIFDEFCNLRTESQSF